MTQQYSHRNGETEPPTVEGVYWFYGLARYPKRKRQRFVLGSMMFYEIYSTPENPMVRFADYYLPLADLSGEWWGPVITPWDDNG